MKAAYLLLSLVLSNAALAVTPDATAAARNFDAIGTDRAGIDNLLATYTIAVSTKNQALFETLLLSKTIPFSYIAPAPTDQGGIANYDAFRRGVFEGAPFTQRFQDIHIQQDGNIANVTLVFVNTTAKGDSWGWKTMQLLKTTGGWKIASEFFTAH